MMEIEAKVKYVKLARSLRTYGVSFFLVKVRWRQAAPAYSIKWRKQKCLQAFWWWSRAQQEVSAVPRLQRCSVVGCGASGGNDVQLFPLENFQLLKAAPASLM